MESKLQGGDEDIIAAPQQLQGDEDIIAAQGDEDIIAAQGDEDIIAAQQQLQKYTRKHAPNARTGTGSGSLLTSGAMTAFLTRKLTGRPNISVRDRLKTRRLLQKRVGDASFLKQMEPWYRFDDLPESRERELGLVPVLKPNQQSQDDYNICVKMQRICLMFLRAYDYVKQNLLDAKFFVKINGSLFQIKLRWEHYEPKLNKPVTMHSFFATAPFLQKVGTRGGIEQQHWEWSRPKVPMARNDFHGDPVVEDVKPSFYHATNGLPLPFVNRRFGLTPQDAKKKLQTLGDWSNYPVDSLVKNHRGDLVSAAAYQTREPPHDTLVHYTHSPGVRDEINKSNKFEIFVTQIYFFNTPIVKEKIKGEFFTERFGRVVNHKHAFIGPPSSWYKNDVRSVLRNGELVHEGAESYIKVLGLFILKLSETHLEDEELQKQFAGSVREVERILTMYFGEDWRETLTHVEIKPRDFHLEKNKSDMEQRIKEHLRLGNPRAMLGGNKKKLKVSRKSKSKLKKINRNYKRKSKKISL